MAIVARTARAGGICQYLTDLPTMPNDWATNGGVGCTCSDLSYGGELTCEIRMPEFDAPDVLAGPYVFPAPVGGFSSCGGTLQPDCVYWPDEAAYNAGEKVSTYAVSVEAKVVLDPCGQQTDSGGAEASATMTGNVNSEAMVEQSKEMLLSVDKQGCDGWRPTPLGWAKTYNVLGISFGYKGAVSLEKLTFSLNVARLLVFFYTGNTKL